MDLLQWDLCHIQYKPRHLLARWRRVNTDMSALTTSLGVLCCLVSASRNYASRGALYASVKRNISNSFKK